MEKGLLLKPETVKPEIIKNYGAKNTTRILFAYDSVGLLTNGMTRAYVNYKFIPSANIFVTDFQTEEMLHSRCVSTLQIVSLDVLSAKGECAVSSTLRPKLKAVVEHFQKGLTDGSVFEAHLINEGNGFHTYKTSTQSISFRDCYVSLDKKAFKRSSPSYCKGNNVKGLTNVKETYLETPDVSKRKRSKRKRSKSVGTKNNYHTASPSTLRKQQQRDRNLRYRKRLQAANRSLADSSSDSGSDIKKKTVKASASKAQVKNSKSKNHSKQIEITLEETKNSNLKKLKRPKRVITEFFPTVNSPKRHKIDSNATAILNQQNSLEVKQIESPLSDCISKETNLQEVETPLISNVLNFDQVPQVLIQENPLIPDVLSFNQVTEATVEEIQSISNVLEFDQVTQALIKADPLSSNLFDLISSVLDDLAIFEENPFVSNSSEFNRVPQPLLEENPLISDVLRFDQVTEATVEENQSVSNVLEFDQVTQALLQENPLSPNLFELISNVLDLDQFVFEEHSLISNVMEAHHQEQTVGASEFEEPSLIPNVSHQYIQKRLVGGSQVQVEETLFDSYVSHQLTEEQVIGTSSEIHFNNVNDPERHHPTSSPELNKNEQKLRINKIKPYKIVPLTVIKARKALKKYASLYNQEQEAIILANMQNINNCSRPLHSYFAPSTNNVFFRVVNN